VRKAGSTKELTVRDPTIRGRPAVRERVVQEPDLREEAIPGVNMPGRAKSRFATTAGELQTGALFCPFKRRVTQPEKSSNALSAMF